MKKYIFPIVTILLALMIAWERFGTRDLIDQDEVVFISDTVQIIHLDTVFQPKRIVVKDYEVRETIGETRFDTIIEEVIKEVIVRDTVKEFFVTEDSVITKEARLRYAILSMGEVIAFLPEMTVYPRKTKLEKVMRSDFGVGAGLGGYRYGDVWRDVYDIEFRYKWVRANYATDVDARDFDSFTIGVYFEF